MKKNYLVLIFILLLANLSLAQTHTADKRENSPIIEDVLIRRNRRIPQSVIDSIIKTQRGQKYNTEQIDKDVRALFNTGHFDDVKCFAEDGVQGGKVVTFELAEKPLVYEVIYAGVDSERQSEVVAELNRQKLELAKGDEYNAIQGKRAAATIRAFLFSKGYQNVTVDCLVEFVEQNEVQVSFTIKL
jgi:outer membrane protein insertion porin family